MRKLSASELLKTWEEGQGCSPYRRAFMLLIAARTEETPEEILSLSIGCRDARLLTLREWIFGPELHCLTGCPSCSEKLEFSAAVSDLRLPETRPPKTCLILEVDDYAVDFRLPNTGDLIAVDGISELSQVQAMLTERCVSDVRCKDEKVGFEQLPSKVIEALALQMELADPQADAKLALACPVCGHRWQALFDIVSYFWSEIHTWALRTLREVHRLASAYSWREADILAMSPLRRHLYLEMAGT